jgi:hypothetical protein
VVWSKRQQRFLKLREEASAERRGLQGFHVSAADNGHYWTWREAGMYFCPFFALFLLLKFHRYEKDMKLFLGFLLIFFSLCHLLMYLFFFFHENQPLLE